MPVPSNGQEVLNKKINLFAEQMEVKIILTDISRLAWRLNLYTAHNGCPVIKRFP